MKCRLLHFSIFSSFKYSLVAFFSCIECICLPPRKSTSKSHSVAISYSKSRIFGKYQYILFGLNLVMKAKQSLNQQTNYRFPLTNAKVQHTNSVCNSRIRIYQQKNLKTIAKGLHNLCFSRMHGGGCPEQSVGQSGHQQWLWFPH